MIFHSEALELLQQLDDNELDFLSTDPPYGLGKPPKMQDVLEAWMQGKPFEAKGKGFMAHDWDKFVPGPELWKETLRVLKPGAHGVVFAGTRTQDLMALSLRLAGFEIRDTLMWMYGTGMPKGPTEVCEDPAFEGYRSNLKPSYEPILLVRKPFKGTLSENLIRYGTGALNTKGCQPGRGNWPPNVVLDEETSQLLDEQSGNRPGMSSGGVHKTRRATIAGGGHDGNPSHHRGDKGGASRFFYSTKTSTKERNAGLEDFPILAGGEAVKRQEGSVGVGNGRAGAGRTGNSRNPHPTVKPIELMRWLIRLIAPPARDGSPPEGIDPFLGSGSTYCAALLEGVELIGCDRSEEYVKVAKARAAHWATVAGKSL